MATTNGTQKSSFFLSHIKPKSWGLINQNITPVITRTNLICSSAICLSTCRAMYRRKNNNQANTTVAFLLNCLPWVWMCSCGGLNKKAYNCNYRRGDSTRTSLLFFSWPCNPIQLSNQLGLFSYLKQAPLQCIALTFESCSLFNHLLKSHSLSAFVSNFCFLKPWLMPASPPPRPFCHQVVVLNRYHDSLRGPLRSLHKQHFGLRSYGFAHRACVSCWFLKGHLCQVHNSFSFFLYTPKESVWLM